jgi:hypothetical protein
MVVESDIPAQLTIAQYRAQRHAASSRRAKARRFLAHLPRR